MPRTKSCRKVNWQPGVVFFKPSGIPMRELQEEVLGWDEVEAIRLVDMEGLYQDAAAEKMGVSRQTIGRILKEARRKIAVTMVSGKALRIEFKPDEVELNGPDTIKEK
ncbi:MAG: DUF134 domain-containing protein [Marinilabiliaceae bacterium]|nr:DUF134 domain-containing protein [Marinilabiliaceae bacterium]